MTELRANWGKMMRDENQFESFLETQQAINEARQQWQVEGVADMLEEMTVLYGEKVVREAMKKYDTT